jgi:Poxvirus A32 protein
MERKIRVFGKAADTVECSFGRPFPSVPTSFLLVGPSGAGKGQVLLNLVLKFYAHKFDRVYCWSPSIYLDPQYLPLRRFLDKLTDQEKEPTYFEDFDAAKLAQILAEQKSIVQYTRERKMRTPQILLILDDMADSEIFSKRRGPLVMLATRGRHLNCSFVASVQKFNMVSMPIRVNCRNLCVWRLRNGKELALLLEELSGRYSSAEILELYRHATDKPFGFLFVRLDARDPKDLFWSNFEARLSINGRGSSSDLDDSDASSEAGGGDGGGPDLRPAQGPVRSGGAPRAVRAVAPRRAD